MAAISHIYKWVTAKLTIEAQPPKALAALGAATTRSCGRRRPCEAKRAIAIASALSTSRLPWSSSTRGRAAQPVGAQRVAGHLACRQLRPLPADQLIRWKSADP